MIWLMEGKAQSMTQWFILLCTSSGMLEYVLVGKAKGGARLSESGGTASNLNINISESVNQKNMPRHTKIEILRTDVSLA